MSEFIDHLKLKAIAGTGGNGCVSFRREKFVPRGGPNGGNGGRGGHVIFQVRTGLNTLAHIRPNSTIRAGKGSHGQGSHKTGSDGEDAIAYVPPGTVVTNVDSGEMIAELLEDDQQHIIARGGKGGLGNAAFAHSTNQAPRYATDGKKGEEVHVELELKLLADVGIIGLPNAGKSTLTARISAARPLVADYPFTTLYPVLGVVKMGFDSFVIADIPGLIEGAHAGSGLGHKFLRHIERTRILLHLVDIGSPDADSPARQVKAIEDELEQYRAELSTKPKLLAGNKIDLNPAPDKIDALKTYANQTGCDYCLVSGATGEGVDDMLKKLFELLQSVPRTEEHRESGS